MRSDRLLHFSMLLAGVSALDVAERQTSTVPLVVTNKCSDTIWPGIETQDGSGPESQGFELTSGSSKNQTVAVDWIGRVWGRTNCTFNADGISTSTCGTGDCGSNITCSATGAPATLAELNLAGYMNNSFYDISLVDGYNLPLAIQVLPVSDTSLLPNTTNPSCVGSVNNLSPADRFNPYSSKAPASQQNFLGTSASTPLPFDHSVSHTDVSTWCPYDLQQNPLQDTHGKPCPCFTGADVPHPKFNPCLSACSKYGSGKYCCTGKYEDRGKCKPNYYSKRAKIICPDAYGFAFDDSSSTFAVPTGQGFEVVFCPGGRSTTILKTQAAAKEGGTTSAAGGPLKLSSAVTVAVAVVAAGVSFL